MKFQCRFCNCSSGATFSDLGMSPISNDFVPGDQADSMEPFFPLHAIVCNECFLVQLGGFDSPDRLFRDDYAYFSSYSESWLRHAKKYADEAIAREGLNGGSTVVEIASNDGYLLRWFKDEGVPVIGVEPTANTAKVALEVHGIESEVSFFGKETALAMRDRGVQADLMAANNVLAHVPDLNDFVSGYPILLKRGGVANFEFPHLLKLIEQKQFDTIYHEHYSYLSFHFVNRLFEAHAMRVYDVEELGTHGGSLRIYVCHADDSTRPQSDRARAMLMTESAAGLEDVQTYENFSRVPTEVKCDLLDFLVSAYRDGKSVAAYGAPAKGNTLLNFCGVKSDLIAFTVDRSPHKQGRLLPGTRIPVLAPEVISEKKPDFLLILPWNLKDEIMEQMSEIRSWGGKFVTPIPNVRIL